VIVQFKIIVACHIMKLIQNLFVNLHFYVLLCVLLIPAIFISVQKMEAINFSTVFEVFSKTIQSSH